VYDVKPVLLNEGPELMSGVEITDVLVNISGKTIHSSNHSTVVAITNKERVVKQEDVDRAIESIISTTQIPSDQEMIHVIARDFSVDDQTNIKEPLGMTGLRLEAQAHIVRAGLTAIHNLEKSIQNAGLKIADRVLSSFASAEAVITEEEKELGVAVIDIGSGVIDIVVFIEGGIYYSAVVPFGSYFITNDLAVGLKTTYEAAEKIKCQFGHCIIGMVDPTEKIEIPPTAGKPARLVMRQDLVRIIEPRMREILELVNLELEKSQKKHMLAGGIILTGGASLLAGIDILAEEVLGLSVTRAKPAGITGLREAVSSPSYSTAVGLIKRYLKNTQTSFDVLESEGNSFVGEKASNTIRKFINWVTSNL
jgi:cell division protein FtsA